MHFKVGIKNQFKLICLEYWIIGQQLLLLTVFDALCFLKLCPIFVVSSQNIKIPFKCVHFQH